MVITFCARLDNRDNGFLQIDNRVVENNYTDLSMEAYMVLTRCLANQSGWQIHWNHFEKKYHIPSLTLYFHMQHTKQIQSSLHSLCLYHNHPLAASHTGMRKYY